MINISIFCSCTKKRTIHFHGRITYKCDGSAVKNITISIIRLYDAGSHHSENIGQTTTDNNGYYSLVADVSETGSFEGYHGYSENFNLSGGSENTSTDVLMDFPISNIAHLSFHIKNISPFNNSDLLDTLAVTIYPTSLDYPSMSLVGNHSMNLVGTNIDTILSSNLNNDNPYYYFYYSSFKKGIRMDKFDSIPAVCFDTTRINVFY